MYYENRQDANLYLSGSVLLLKSGTPFRVDGVDEGMVVVGYNYKSGKNTAFPIEEFELKSPRIGYHIDNATNTCRYIERIPSRSWRQGLTRDNCREKNSSRFMQRWIFRTDRRLAITSLFKDPTIPLSVAYKKAEEIQGEYPFHWDFSVDNNKIIRYKTKIIGSYYLGNISLLDNFKYLKELIEQEVVLNENT